MTELIGRTITVEEIGHVPELAHVWRIDQYDWRIIERLDGVFVRDRGTGDGINHMWDDARLLAERLEIQWVGPGRPERVSAQEVPEGWHVLTGPPRNQRWCRVTKVTEVVNLAKMRETGQPRPKIRIEVEGRAPITRMPPTPVECRRFWN